MLNNMLLTEKLSTRVAAVTGACLRNNLNIDQQMRTTIWSYSKLMLLFHICCDPDASYTMFNVNCSNKLAIFV